MLYRNLFVRVVHKVQLQVYFYGTAIYSIKRKDVTRHMGPAVTARSSSRNHSSRLSGEKYFQATRKKLKTKDKK